MTLKTTKVTLEREEGMKSIEEFKEIHGKHKAAVIEGKKYHANVIIATVGIFPTKHLAVYRPPDYNCWVLGVNTLVENYNDPTPVIREIDTLMDKLQQLKMTFMRAWENEMTQPTQEIDCRLTQMYHVEDKPKEADLMDAFEKLEVPAEQVAKELTQLEEKLLGTVSQYCSELNHKKDCRCHLGYRIKLK